MTTDDTKKILKTIIKEIREIESPYSNLNSMDDYKKARNKALKIVHAQLKKL